MPWKIFSKIFRSGSTLNCRHRHSRIKLMANYVCMYAIGRQLDHPFCTQPKPLPYGFLILTFGKFVPLDPRKGFNYDNKHPSILVSFANTIFMKLSLTPYSALQPHATNICCLNTLIACFCKPFVFLYWKILILLFSILYYIYKYIHTS